MARFADEVTLSSMLIWLARPRSLVTLVDAWGCNSTRLSREASRDFIRVSDAALRCGTSRKSASNTGTAPHSTPGVRAVRPASPHTMNSRQGVEVARPWAASYREASARPELVFGFAKAHIKEDGLA